MTDRLGEELVRAGLAKWIVDPDSGERALIPTRKGARVIIREMKRSPERLYQALAEYYEDAGGDVWVTLAFLIHLLLIDWYGYDVERAVAESYDVAEELRRG